MALKQRVRFDYTPAEGCYFVGPAVRGGLTIVEKDGQPKLVGPGDPIPEAFDFRNNRRKTMLERDQLRFVPKGAVPVELLEMLIEGLTPEAHAAAMKRLGLPVDDSIDNVIATLQDAGLTSLAAIPDIFKRRPPPPRIREKRIDEPTPAELVKRLPLTREAYEAKGLDFEDGLYAASGETLNRLIGEAGLQAQFVNLVKRFEREARDILKGVAESTPERLAEAKAELQVNIGHVARAMLASEDPREEFSMKTEAKYLDVVHPWLKRDAEKAAKAKV